MVSSLPDAGGRRQPGDSGDGHEGPDCRLTFASGRKPPMKPDQSQAPTPLADHSCRRSAARLELAPGVPALAACRCSRSTTSTTLVAARPAPSRAAARAGAIVDRGITSDATRAAWEQVFERRLQDLPVPRVIVTHAPTSARRTGSPTLRRTASGSAPPTSTPRVPASQSTTGFGGERRAASHGLVADPEASWRRCAGGRLLREHGAAGAGRAFAA